MIRDVRTVGSLRKGILALVFAILFLVLFVEAVVALRILSIIVTALLTAVFSLIASRSLYPLSFTREGIDAPRFMGGRIAWSDVKEVGIIGERVFPKGKDGELSGRLYIYFSSEELDEDGRFSLALEWPPRGMPYTEYSKKKIERIALLWEKDIVNYSDLLRENIRPLLS